jgi:microcystin-dependent protein
MKRLFATAALAGALHLTGVGLASAQQVDQYLGELRVTAFNFCPTGWFMASGQIVSIQQYTALFALIGTTYGGNGTINFALPNLNGRAPYGNDPSGSVGQPIGAVYGQSQVTLTSANLPAHSHQAFASSAGPSTNNPAGGLSASFPSGENVYAAAGSPANVAFSPSALGITGQSLPFNNQSPALSMTWCIAWEGIFPSRP